MDERYCRMNEAIREDGETQITLGQNYQLQSIRYPGTGGDTTGYCCIRGLIVSKI